MTESSSYTTANPGGLTAGNIRHRRPVPGSAHRHQPPTQPDEQDQED